jgi:hypothetical protein
MLFWMAIQYIFCGNQKVRHAVNVLPIHTLRQPQRSRIPNTIRHVTSTRRTIHLLRHH